MNNNKTTPQRIPIRQLSPEIPSPVKITESIQNDHNIENKQPIEAMEENDQNSSTDSNSNENKIDLNSTSIILANGQPLLTNFEEKYLIDTILKPSTKDIEIILQEKIHFILQMNYGSQSLLFTLNSNWIFDFILKHFQTLIDHMNSSELFEKILNKNFDKNNSTIAFKHWQLKTLVDEHTKKQQQQQQQSNVAQKRRMTVRRIDFT